MSAKEAPWLAEEIADFLASCPAPEEILAYRPSARVRNRLRALLDKGKQGRLTQDEQHELKAFDYAEALMQLVKARLRG